MADVTHRNTKPPTSVPLGGLLSGQKTKRLQCYHLTPGSQCSRHEAWKKTDDFLCGSVLDMHNQVCNDAYQLQGYTFACM